MSAKKKLTKYQALQKNDPAGRIVAFLIGFIANFLPITIAQRLAALFFIAADLPIQRICVLTGMCEKTVRKIKRESAVVPLVSLLSIKKGSGRKGDLLGVEEEIKKELNTNNYFSRQQIADMIWDKFRIRIKLSAVGAYLKKWGYKRLKSGSLPAKADPEKQATFYDEVLHPLMKKAKKGKIALLFMDGSHFVFGCDFLGYIYSLVRRFVETFSGRQRYNVLGALNFVTKKIHTVKNNTYLNAETVCELLQEIAKEYAGQTIHVILDNARYQKCKGVTSLAKELGIILEYIPPYSPNLNLIERIWKFVKARLRTKHCENFEEFKEVIDQLIDSTTCENRQQIDTLIREKVQLFRMNKIAEGTYETEAKTAA